MARTLRALRRRRRLRRDGEAAGARKVAAPTLLIRGRDSEVVPEAAVEMVLAGDAGLQVVTVPGGHIVMWDAFDETASAMLAFLEDSRA